MPTEIKFLSVDAICLPLDLEKAPSYAGFLSTFSVAGTNTLPLENRENDPAQRLSGAHRGIVEGGFIIMIKAILVASAIVLAFGAMLPFLIK